MHPFTPVTILLLSCISDTQVGQHHLAINRTLAKTDTLLRVTDTAGTVLYVCFGHQFNDHKEDISNGPFNFLRCILAVTAFVVRIETAEVTFAINIMSKFIFFYTEFFVKK